MWRHHTAEFGELVAFASARSPDPQQDCLSPADATFEHFA
jgi:hypothetical protein